MKDKARLRIGPNQCVSGACFVFFAGVMLLGVLLSSVMLAGETSPSSTRRAAGVLLSDSQRRIRDGVLRGLGKGNPTASRRPNLDGK